MDETKEINEVGNDVPENNLEPTSKKKKGKFKLPTIFTILLAITLVVVLISWIPGTTKPYNPDPETNKGIVGGPAGIFDIFLAPMYGFKEKVDVIIFILILGGFLGIIIESKALDAGIGRIIKKMKGREVAIIPIIMILFSIGGTVYGMGEETIALYPVIIPIFVAAGFDVMTAVLTILLGAGTGVIASTLNPFVIQAAVAACNDTKQNTIEVIEKISPSTGIVWRFVIWTIFTAASTGFVVWYALRVKKRPEKSVLFAQKDEIEKNFTIFQDLPEYTKKRKAILAIFIITFIIMIISLVAWDKFNIPIFVEITSTLKEKFPYLSKLFEPLGKWAFYEISALFLISSIIIAFIDWHGEEAFVGSFVKNTSDILSVCLVIAFAIGIGYIMNKTGMQAIIVESMKSPMSKLGKDGFILVSYFFFLLLSFVLTSTSGFASTVFPIMGPLANQTLPGLASGAITGFSLANGIINLISPTSATLMAALAISKCSYDKYLKASWPILVGLFVGSIVLLEVGVAFLPIGFTKPWF